MQVLGPERRRIGTMTSNGGGTMKIRVGTWTRIGLVLLGVVAVPGLAALGQAFPGPLVNLTAGGLVPLPPPPPPGAWGEVIFANERWIVVQNSEGQQFPIA